MDEQFNENDFEALKQGDDDALDKLYRANFNYVLGLLVHKYGASTENAKDIFSESVLILQAKSIEGKIKWGNIKGYLLKMSVNFVRQNQRKTKNRIKLFETYINELDSDTMDFDGLVADEEEKYKIELQKQKIVALKWAMEQINETCRDLLTDTVIKGLKPRFLFEKYGYKNARVLTDRNSRCKKKLLNLVQQRLST